MLWGFLALSQSSAQAAQSVTLGWDPSPDPTVVGYNVYYGGASGSYTNELNVGNATSITISNLVEGATYYFVVTAYDSSNLESLPSNEVSYSVPVGITITLTSPSGGTSYPAPATVSLAANVVTTSHTITQVDFYNGSTVVGTSTGAPYAYTWSGVGVGSYTVFARVTYDSGSTLDSAPATITVTSTPPAIALSAPVSGSSYQAPASISLSANVTANNHTITQVQFYNGSTLLGSDTQPPYNYSWNNVSAGTYSLKARLVYDSGSTLDSTVATVTVTNPPPAIVLTTPANGAGFAAPATVNLAASVTANGHTISQVQFYNGSTLLGSDTSSPYTYSWSSVGVGSYGVKARLVYDGGTTMDTTVATITVTNPLPTVALLTPVNGTVYSAPATITCAATIHLNGHTLSTVQFYNDTNYLGQASTAPYSVNWTCTNSGYYNLNARMVYDSGSTVDSPIVRVQVNPPPPPNVYVVTVSGAGTVTPNLTTDTLVTGNRYTVTAVPAAGQLFAGWSGSLSATSSTVGFLMTPGFHIQANFLPFPNGGVAASYYGLFYESNQVQQTSSGAFVLTTTKRGTYSGYAQIGTTRLPFRGVLDQQGHGTSTILRPGQSTLALDFTLVGGQPGDQVQGTLTAPDWVAGLSGDRAVYSAKTSPAPLKGAYTLVIPGPGSPDPGLPFGHSYGLVNIDPAGHVRLSASLADGTRLTQSAPLSARGYWGLYAPLYGGQGSVLSWVGFTNRPTDDFNGALSWIKPAGLKTQYYPGGFTNDCVALGSAFTPVPQTNSLGLNATSATLSFTGGGLAADFANSLAETASGHLSNLSNNRVSLSVSRTTGAFRGSVTDPSSGKSLPFAGVLFQKAQAGYGFLLDLGQSSQVQLAE